MSREGQIEAELDACPDGNGLIIKIYPLGDRSTLLLEEWVPPGAPPGWVEGPAQRARMVLATRDIARKP